MDKLDIETLDDKTLRQALAVVPWPIRWGCVIITIRDGKPTMVKVERTIKLD
jgi:hypothetical protein